MAKRKRYGTGFGTTSTPGDVLRRKNRRYNRQHRNPRAATQRLMRDVFGIDVNDMTMDVGGDLDIIEEILAEIAAEEEKNQTSGSRRLPTTPRNERIAKLVQAVKAPRQMMDIEEERVSMPPRQMPLTSGSVSRPKGRNLIPYPKGADPRVGSSIDSSSLRLGQDEVIPELAAPYRPPPLPPEIPLTSGSVSRPRTSRDERAARIAAEGFDPRTEALRRLEERGGLSSSQRIPGESSVVAEAQVTEEDDDGSWTDSIQKVIEQIKSQIGKYPPESEKRIADAKKAHDAQTKRMIELAGTRDSVMDEPVRGYYVDSQMDEPVMDDSVSVESFMDEPIDAYDPNTVMQPEDLKVDYGFDIRATEPGMSRGTEQAEQMITIDETTDETMESIPGLHRSHQHADSGSRVSVDPVKKMEESWYDAEGNKTNRLGATIDNFFRGIFGGAEPGGETSPWGILAKQDLTKFKDEPWLAEGGMVRKKYRKGGKVKFNSGGTVGWGKAIKGHNTNRDICKKCPI